MEVAKSRRSGSLLVYAAWNCGWPSSSDGVCAIIVTLLVLELKVPGLRNYQPNCRRRLSVLRC